jgi:hypothetical protein
MFSRPRIQQRRRFSNEIGDARIQDDIAYGSDRRQLPGITSATDSLDALFRFRLSTDRVRAFKPERSKRMKAYVVETANGPFPEVEIPALTLMSGQVLVRICASGINPLDTKAV